MNATATIDTTATEQNEQRMINALRDAGVLSAHIVALRANSCLLKQLHVMGFNRELTAEAYNRRKLKLESNIAKIMRYYQSLSAYIQPDPRGCSLYIIRPGDVPSVESVESYYTNGIAIY